MPSMYAEQIGSRALPLATPGDGKAVRHEPVRAFGRGRARERKRAGARPRPNARTEADAYLGQRRTDVTYGKVQVVAPKKKKIPWR
jgi:hypothetical protein